MKKSDKVLLKPKDPHSSQLQCSFGQLSHTIVFFILYSKIFFKKKSISLIFIIDFYYGIKFETFSRSASFIFGGSALKGLLQSSFVVTTMESIEGDEQTLPPSNLIEAVSEACPSLPTSTKAFPRKGFLSRKLDFICFPGFGQVFALSFIRVLRIKEPKKKY